MAEQVIKKIVIPKKDLPPLDGNNLQYSIKFRILSDDKNRSSYWSPIYNISVDAEAPTDITHIVHHDNNTDLITAVWTLPAILTETPTTAENIQANLKEFDVYVQWDLEPWKYVTTVNNTIYAINKKTGASTIKIAVQKPTFPKERFTGATLFESNSVNV